MTSLIIKALSNSSTIWTMRQYYALDTASLLLAGADPVSINTGAPENVTVWDAVFAPIYANESQAWRARLVRAALAGDLAVSIDGQPGTVGAWASDTQWAPVTVNEAARHVRAFELRDRELFFDIGRDDLASWLEGEGGTLPFWLAGGASAGVELKTKASAGTSCGRWWYGVPLRWAFSTGLQKAGSARELLREIAKDMKRRETLKGITQPNDNAYGQRAAADAALLGMPVDLDDPSIPTNSRESAAGFWGYAAARAGVGVADPKAVKAALRAAGIPCPSPAQLDEIKGLF